jgi:hypothetical protein
VVKDLLRESFYFDLNPCCMLPCALTFGIYPVTCRNRTIALLLALGEMLETPFRVMDEFDVFVSPSV